MPAQQQQPDISQSNIQSEGFGFTFSKETQSQNDLEEVKNQEQSKAISAQNSRIETNINYQQIIQKISQKQLLTETNQEKQSLLNQSTSTQSQYNQQDKQYQQKLIADSNDNEENQIQSKGTSSPLKSQNLNQNTVNKQNFEVSKVNLSSSNQNQDGSKQNAIGAEKSNISETRDQVLPQKRKLPPIPQEDQVGAKETQFGVQFVIIEPNSDAKKTKMKCEICLKQFQRKAIVKHIDSQFHKNKENKPKKVINCQPLNI